MAQARTGGSASANRLRIGRPMIAPVTPAKAAKLVTTQPRNAAV
jgi:hypothetical protein